MATVVSSIQKGLSRVAHALRSVLVLIVLLIVLFVGLIWLLISWPFRWRPKPFDATTWRSEQSKQSGDRYRMVEDLIRKIRGKSREEVIALLGEPDRPCPRHFAEAPDRSCDLAYYLCPSRPIGRWELLIRLDENARVKAANASYSD